jgi:hypothetical protein
MPYGVDIMCIPPFLPQLPGIMSEIWESKRELWNSFGKVAFLDPV